MFHISQLSPYIRVAMDSYIPFPWYLRERVLFDYELLYVKEGIIEVTVEERIYRGEPGDLFLFRPNQRHSIRKLGTGMLRQPHLHFDLFQQDDSPNVKVSFKTREAMSKEETGWFRPDALDQFEPPLPSHLRLRNAAVIENMMFEIIREFQMKLPYYEWNIKGLFTQLLIALMRENYWASNPHLLSNINELEHVRNYLKHHIGRKVTLEELAKEAGISKFYLISLFKQTFGMTPIQYHQTLRIEKAREMVQFTNEPFKSIAEKFGFPDIHSFSKTFKKVDGVYPSFYRKRKAEPRE